MITGIYNSTPPTLSDGQQVQIQTDPSGNIKTAIQGDVASGTANSGNPVQIGGWARASLDGAVTVGQRVAVHANLFGGLFTFNSTASGGTPVTDGFLNSATGLQIDFGGAAIIPTSANFNYNGTAWDRARGDVNGAVVQPALSTAFWAYAGIAGGIVSSTADVAMKAAAGASVRNYIKSLTIAHDVLSAVTECVVKDGSTIIWRGKLQTPAVDSAAGSGTIIFDPPLRGTANTALNFALLSSVTGGVFVNAQGYTGA